MMQVDGLKLPIFRAAATNENCTRGQGGRGRETECFEGTGGVRRAYDRKEKSQTGLRRPRLSQELADAIGEDAGGLICFGCNGEEPAGRPEVFKRKGMTERDEICVSGWECEWIIS